MLRLCLSVASLALLTSRLVCVVLLANRLSLVLPYLLWYHTLLPSAVISKRLCAKASGLGLSQASQHDADHGEVNPGFFAAGEHLIVLGKPTPAGKPGEGTLANPAVGKNMRIRSVGSSPNRSPHPLGPRHLPARSRDVPQSRRPILAPPDP